MRRIRLVTAITCLQSRMTVQRMNPHAELDDLYRARNPQPTQVCKYGIGGAPFGEKVTWLPTAHALLALGAVTPHRSLSLAPARGTGTTRQALPFQRSISDGR